MSQMKREIFNLHPPHQNKLSKLDCNPSVDLLFDQLDSTVIWYENRANRASDNQADSNSFLAGQCGNWPMHLLTRGRRKQ